MGTIIKWAFHICTLFVPLIIWKILVFIFTESYETKLKNIDGVGGGKLKGILEKFPDEEALKNADIKEIKSIYGIGEALAVQIKKEFY